MYPGRAAVQNPPKGIKEPKVPKSDFGAFLTRFGTPRGSKNLDFRYNCRQKSRRSCFFKAVRKRDPKNSQRNLPGGQNDARERPERAQERPKKPKSAQEPPKVGFRAVGGQLGPTWRPKALRGLQEAIFEPQRDDFPQTDKQTFQY